MTSLVSRATRAAVAAVLAFAVPLAARAQDAPTVDVERMQQVIQERAADGRFMGAVLVARDDQVLLSRAWGSADLEWDVPNTPDAKFRLGSVTKQFTAAAILLLEEDGRLRIEDPVSMYLPDALEAWANVTLFHLLTHSSGIPNFTSFPEYETWKLSPSPAETTVSRFRDKPLEFAPGERMSYSNSGYVLLGLLVEKVGRRSYADFLQQRLFGPLEMRDTGYDSGAEILKHRAHGYSPTDHGPVNASYIDMTIPGGAGGLYSTTGDLLRWTRGLFGGRVLSAASLQKMTTPYKNDYALGLAVSEVNGHKVIRHGGGIDGFNTFLAWYPESKVTVAVLANINGPAADGLAAALGALAHGDPVTLPGERSAMEVPEARLQELAGSYELAPTANLILEVVDGRLMSRVAGEPSIELFAESEDHYFARAVDAQLDVERDADGAVAAIVLHQGGRDLRAPRVVTPVAVELGPDVLAAYAGTYALAPGFDLEIRVEDGRLWSQATGQPSAELHAEAVDRFFLKVANARIDFERGPDGAVVALVLHQGGRDMRAPRK